MQRMPGFIASGRRSPREWLPALILALLLCSSASADVVIKEKSVSEGPGGFGNRTTSRTLIVAGDKSRSEDEAEKQTGEMSNPGTAAGGPLMRVVTEVISISTSSAPAGGFDVPTGYTLQKTK